MHNPRSSYLQVVKRIFGILKVQLCKVLFFTSLIILLYVASLMWIGLVLLMINGLPLVLVSFSNLIFSHGLPINSLLFLILVLKQNIVLLPILSLKSVGLVSCFLFHELAFLFILHLEFMSKIFPPSIWLQILSLSMWQDPTWIFSQNLCRALLPASSHTNVRINYYTAS